MVDFGVHSNMRLARCFSIQYWALARCRGSLGLTFGLANFLLSFSIFQRL